jgi:hypothetical protein
MGGIRGAIRSVSAAALVAFAWGAALAQIPRDPTPAVARTSPEDIAARGSEAAVRGFLDSYDAKTGKRLWRLWTVPREGEPEADTWGGALPEGGTTWNAARRDDGRNEVSIQAALAFLGGHTRDGRQPRIFRNG